MGKNITVTVPDEVYAQARVHAAEQGTSVSRMVAEYLALLSRTDAEFAKAAARRREIVSRIEHFSASDRLSRDELHDRATLR